MKGKELSPGQWGCLLWTAGLAPAAELLPGVALELAGRGAWLAPLGALGLLLPLLLLCRGGGEITGERRGDRIFLLLYCLWLWLLLTLRLGLCARRMLWSGERDGAVWYFLLTLAALTLWMGQGKVESFGRAAQIFLAILLGAGVLVLGLSLPRVRPDRILPLWTQDILPVGKAGVAAAGCLCWSLAPCLLLPCRREGWRDRGTGWVLSGCILLTLAQGIILGNLGVELAGRTDSAFLALTKSVGIEGAFQRVESIIAALWMLSDLALCVALVFVLEQGGGVLLSGLPRGSTGSFGLLTAAGGALWLCRRGMPLEMWNREWVWLGNLLACVLGALWLRVRGALVKKTKQG